MSIQTIADRADGSFMYRKNIQTFLSAAAFLFIFFLHFTSFFSPFIQCYILCFRLVKFLLPIQTQSAHNRKKKNKQRYNIYFIRFFIFIYLFLPEPNAKATTTRNTKKKVFENNINVVPLSQSHKQIHSDFISCFFFIFYLLQKIN